MLPAILRSRRTLVENIKSLEIQLADLQERLNIIVDWINLQCCGLLVIPETVIIAMRGYVRPTSLSVVTPKKNKIFRSKGSLPLGVKKGEPRRVKAQQSNSDILNLTISNDDEIEHQNPVVRLEKLSEVDINILKHTHATTNLTPTNSIQTTYSNINFENSSLLFCPICNEHFKLRIQLEKHKLACQSKNLTIAYYEYSSTKLREYTPIAEANEDSVYRDVISFSPAPFEESYSECDPLGDVISNDNCATDVMENINEKIIHDLPDTGGESVVKYEIDIKEETREDDVFISQDTNTSERPQQPEEKSYLLRSGKKSGNISMQQHIVEKSCVRNNKIILSLSEYEKVVASIGRTGRRSLVCVICNQTFKKPQTVYQHEMKMHLSKEDHKRYLNRRSSDRIQEMKSFTFICKICGRPCKDPYKLDKHRMSHVSSEVKTEVDGDGRPNYRCLNCDSPFSVKRKCVLHVVRNCENEKDKREEKERKQEKKLSEKNKKRTIIKHNKVEKRKHKSSKTVMQCEKCGFNSSSNYKLKIHMRTHAKEKKFVCSQCGQRFVLKQTMLQHELAIHTKERPHKCQYCEKTFVLKFVKNNHEKLHLGTLEVSCHICGFTFSTKQILKRHIASIHEKLRPYKCDMCDKSFKSSNSRNYHVKTHNNPNGRKRSLNKEIDDLKAAAKRRAARNRIPLLNTLTDSIKSPAKVIQNTFDIDTSQVPQEELLHSSK